MSPNRADATFANGSLLVFGSALVWSFGGTIARFLTTDGWTTIFWRAIWAFLFLLGFLLVRDGPRATLDQFRRMRLPSIGVGCCFASASISFVIALQHTTVANILLVQASVPLLAAFMAWLFFRERVQLATWMAIGFVIAGIAVMVSGSFEGNSSPVGDSLAFLISFSFAGATVITRRFAHVQMIPAVALGAVISAAISAFMTMQLGVSLTNMMVLFVFGALNLGLGLVMFVLGARLIPASIAALIGTGEPVLGPVWVWLIHDERPGSRTLIGGAIVIAALFCHSLWQVSAARRTIA
jgi:drug/metabolite transporter (DMT)-like permease